MKNASLQERLTQKISPEPNSGCWLWAGAMQSQGYGHIRYQGKNILAHRLSYELRRGAIPEDKFLDHLCRTPACVNPDHLEPVTPKENVRRGFWGRKTACKNGHPYTDASTYRTPGDGWRQCRICAAESKQRCAA